MIEWHKWKAEKPKAGSKIVIFCDDACSTAAAFVAVGELENSISILHAEDGYELDRWFLDGSIWAYMPDDTPLAFMEYG
jgi:hypothetical protein